MFTKKDNDAMKRFIDLYYESEYDKREILDVLDKYNNIMQNIDTALSQLNNTKKSQKEGNKTITLLIISLISNLLATVSLFVNVPSYSTMVFIVLSVYCSISCLFIVFRG